MSPRNPLLLLVAVLSLGVTGLLIARWPRHSGPRRVAVHGSVQEADKPIGPASIRFIPRENHNPVAATLVTDGKYRFTSDDGPFPGRYSVVVTSEPVNFGKQPADIPAVNSALWEWKVEATVADQDELELNLDW